MPDTLYGIPPGQLRMERCEERDDEVEKLFYKRDGGQTTSDVLLGCFEAFCSADTDFCAWDARGANLFQYPVFN